MNKRSSAKGVWRSVTAHPIRTAISLDPLSVARPRRMRQAGLDANG
jgi:hypothetical protein